MTTAPLTDAQREQYQQDGFILLPQLFSQAEIELLRKSAKEDRVLDKHAFDRGDGEGGSVRLSLWNHPGDGIYGMFARCHRLVDTADQLLNDEAYHYHSKMIMKDAKVGGAWTWHQDYGYWYQNGVLEPNLTSCYIAVDNATIENGCLQVIKGSHRLGRIDHVLTGDQAGADQERVDEVLKRLDLIHVTMKAGDALFFHSNLLHRSDQNKSDHARWAMICCYNAKSNDPYLDRHHPRYTPLKKVSDEEILRVGVKRFSDDTSNVAWLADELEKTNRVRNDESDQAQSA